MMRQLILGASFLTTGLALYMAWERGARAVRYRIPTEVGYMLLDIGIAVVVALVNEAVYGIPDVPVTWRTVLYAVGLFAISVGLFLIAWNAGKHNKRSTDHQEG